VYARAACRVCRGVQVATGEAQQAMAIQLQLLQVGAWLAVCVRVSHAVCMSVPARACAFMCACALLTAALSAPVLRPLQAQLQRQGQELQVTVRRSDPRRLLASCGHSSYTHTTRATSHVFVWR
jgi:hypothetical protein